MQHFPYKEEIKKQNQPTLPVNFCYLFASVKQKALFLPNEKNN